MKIQLDVTKSLEQNAETYFNKAKKAKRKLGGAKEALEKSFLKLEKAKKDKLKQEAKKEKVERKKEWYEKFRWFRSSEGFLCIGGRDATSNEIVIKKHMDKDDIVFHTNMAGSPFFVIKIKEEKPTEATINEVAQATASYSRGWKAGIASADVFFVNPSQVTKEAKSGEFVPKGAFMIYGKKNTLVAELRIAIGLKDGQIIGGPIDAIRAQTDNFVIVIQGNEKTSGVAKKIKKKLKGGSIDEIIRMIPAGGCKVQ
ncbi:MAG: NFACT RNA binding domain-containing protein [Candidatus Woesearchaeota archaeon]